MSILSVFHPSSPELPNKVLTHHDDITATLAEQGLRFVHRPHELRVRPGSGQDEVMAACSGLLDQLMSEHGGAAFTLLNRDGVDPGQIDLRDEHVHDADEVFAVVTGRGQVSLRVNDYVFAVLCEKGDVLVVPAGVRRWFDLGDAPFCLALRVFGSEQGMPPRFTGDDSARQFPGIDEF
ncbi:oxidase [Pseudomonas guariconensis]|uniref:cupin domain-containing protein n=1 Tax=Pseudomonas TaxID=286 RepID=UPI001CE3BB44|nr:MULTISPECIES: cupin domain-containing protein [Pseudomonas]MCO7517259.1 oxidase [Pseudomonas putida]MCO7596046.1 oxidase [Pseudomonas guariconensis]MCO7607552.1 oxidase [Pseudomonas guariconensis]MCO7630527.1 oxidase [Pseudomonas guariconensis]MCU7222188.1 oxidase [Pseudomonas brassicacearum]